MKKSEIIEIILNICSKHQLNQEIIKDFELAFKSKAKRPANREVDGKIEKFCRFCQEYHELSEFTSDKNYCKISYRLWDKINKEVVKPLKIKIDRLTKDLLNAEPDKMVQIAKELNELKSKLAAEQDNMNNNAQMYRDYRKDNK
jgi:RNAse (barnase) inhibitor barstar